MTPAKLVVKKMGGMVNTARFLRTDRSTVHHWIYRGKGVVPQRWHKRILLLSAKLNLGITPLHLIYGDK